MPNNDEYTLFLEEVANVRPLGYDDTLCQKKVSTPTAAQLARRLAAAAKPQPIDALTMGEVVMRDPHEIVGFKREGIQEGVYKKLRLGKYPLQASLYLHQKSVAQAREAVVAFIEQCESRDLRCLLILHGKGELSSPPARLKSYVTAWLPELEAVIAFHSATLRHTGSGALYVLLRKSARQQAHNREIQQKRRG